MGVKLRKAKANKVVKLVQTDELRKAIELIHFREQNKIL